MAHPGVSLDELGARADPPVSKDAIAGQLRRLLWAADTRAAQLGIPDTTAATAAEPGSGTAAPR